MAMWCELRRFDNSTEAFFHIAPPKLSFVQKASNESVTIWSMYIWKGHHISNKILSLAETHRFGTAPVLGRVEAGSWGTWPQGKWEKGKQLRQFLQTKYLRSNLLGSKGDCLLTLFCQVWCYPLKPGWEWIVDHNLDSLSFCLCSFYYYLVDFLARGEGGKFMSACVTKHYLWNVKKIYIGGPLKWKEFTMIESFWNLSKCKFLCQLLWCVSQVSTSGCTENALLSCIKLVLTQHQGFDLKQQH